MGNMRKCGGDENVRGDWGKKLIKQLVWPTVETLLVKRLVRERARERNADEQCMRQARNRK